MLHMQINQRNTELIEVYGSCEQTMSFQISIQHFSKSEEVRRYINEKKLFEKKFKILKYTSSAGNVCVSIHHFRRLRAPQPSYVCPRTTRKDAETSQNKSQQTSRLFFSGHFLAEVFQRFNVQYLQSCGCSTQCLF